MTGMLINKFEKSDSVF